MCALWYMYSRTHTHTHTKQTLKTLNDKASLERTKPTWPLALPCLYVRTCVHSTQMLTHVPWNLVRQGSPSWAKVSLCSIKVFALLPLTNLLMSHGHLVTRRHWEGLSRCSIRLRQPVQTELKPDLPPQPPSATRNP